MRLRILAVGRLKAGPERSLVERYQERCRAIARQHGCSGPDIVELPEARARQADDRRAEEGARLQALLAGAPFVAFDEHGESPGSEEFADWLIRFRDSGRRDLGFVIGGPDGLAPALSGAAERVLAFGRMTIPHQLVRLLVAEQLYRAFTIIAGHPYHRAGGGEG